MKQSQAERFMLDGVTYTVDPQTKLGAGSEGMVIQHPWDATQCIKLFHPPDPGAKSAQAIAAYRGRKISAICAAPPALPRHFILPKRQVSDPKTRAIVGYQMDRVAAGYFKLKELTSSAFRTSQSIGLSNILELYADLFDDLALIHKSGLVVGDFNLGCIMFMPRSGRAWVDTDSWSYPGFPGVATTEMFAHPELYANLDPDSTRAVNPVPRHDRFALTIALTMMALPGMHPFIAGSHTSVRGLQNRATAGITVFDQDVKVPAMYGSPELLSDELLNALIDRLKRRTDLPLDPGLLRRSASETVMCGNCKTGYHTSRRQCPKCSQATSVQVTGILNYLIEELWDTRGATLLFAQLVGKNLHLVCRVGRTAQVVRLDERGIATVFRPELKDVPGARYRFFGDCLAVCREPASATASATIQVYRLRGDTLQGLGETTTGVLANEGAVFDTSTRYLYRTAGNALLRTELFAAVNSLTDTQIGTVHQQQSWFTADHSVQADREVVFGYDRAFLSWEWFLIHSNGAGNHTQYHKVNGLDLLPAETVEDFAVYFSANSVLLVRQTARAGRDYVRYAVIGFDGVVHLEKIIDAADPTYAYWSNIRGKLHQGGSVLHATPDGIVKQSFTDGRCTVLPETTGRVSADDRLVRLDGRVGIVRRSGILTLSKK